eukprot:TRINITY_DN1011_c0_g1_i1.p1 TRINITY_DN1011_c0_g1~~TRINITY_DN1011_c0_g1_i1.p1  ORF type:complete len:743 (-),score=118.34 TRINITY_DN1011_c0_g1_i1:113-2341(-)
MWHAECLRNDHCFCKLLVPDAVDKGCLGSELERISGRFRLSPRDCFFPGTHERMLILEADTRPGLIQLMRQFVFLFKEAQKIHGSPESQLRMAVPNSSVSQLIGRGGRKNRNLRLTTGCFTHVSPRVDSLQERLVTFIGSQESTLQAVADVCSQVQSDPNLSQHMHFVYNVEVPLGVWDSCRPVRAAGPKHDLLSPEAAQKYTKRDLIEYLHKVAPSEVLLRHALLGNISKTVKRKCTASVNAAVLEVWSLLAETPTPPSISEATGIAEAQPDCFQFEAEESQVASGRRVKVIRFCPAEANAESPKAPAEEHAELRNHCDFLQLVPTAANGKTIEDDLFTTDRAGSLEFLDLMPTMLHSGASNDSSLGEATDLPDFRVDEASDTDDTDASYVDEAFCEALPEDERPVVGGSYFCKFLVPAYIAGAMIGKGGSSIAELEHSTGCQLLLSASSSSFPGTTERILVMGGPTEDSLMKCLKLVLERMRELGRTRGPKILVKLVTPNSAVSQVIGMGGCNTRHLSQQTGCRIHISPRCSGIQERLIYIHGRMEGIIMAATSVCSQLQSDPHLQKHMHFSYDIDLPIGAWDAEEPGPAEPDHPLLSPEDARKHTKREMIEYLLKAAPRNLLLQHRLKGKMSKSLKSKSTDTVLAAVEETWKLRMGALCAETSLSRQEQALPCEAGSGFLFEDTVPTGEQRRCLRYFPKETENVMLFKDSVPTSERQRCLRYFPKEPENVMFEKHPNMS